MALSAAASAVHSSVCSHIARTPAASTASTLLRSLSASQPKPCCAHIPSSSSTPPARLALALLLLLLAWRVPAATGSAAAAAAAAAAPAPSPPPAAPARMTPAGWDSLAPRVFAHLAKKTAPLNRSDAEFLAKFHMVSAVAVGFSLKGADSAVMVGVMMLRA
jgi:hypothetical protein